MKTIKFLAVIVAFALSLTVSLATKPDGSDTIGVPLNDCDHPSTFQEGTCWVGGHGTQCTLSSNGADAYDRSICSVPMTINQ